jgi:hypothetical protein
MLRIESSFYNSHEEPFFCTNEFYEKKMFILSCQLMCDTFILNCICEFIYV